MSVSVIIITYLMGSFKLNIGNNVEQANNTVLLEYNVHVYMTSRGQNGNGMYAAD